ncbi:hypothetical protein TBK1r_62350 [Stieleria magnilauensis]|uniref:Uncharacterized protein n=1 Tax=Stieleria magnilauensis TaxID=2527963 RepID=A0ABX5XZJ8_9BACT|nr:hypothetical protein TBK1r_62350 [Planctomycetes bacterium TBK1r]
MDRTIPVDGWLQFQGSAGCLGRDRMSTPRTRSKRSETWGSRFDLAVLGSRIDGSACRFRDRRQRPRECKGERRKAGRPCLGFQSRSTLPRDRGSGVQLLGTHQPCSKSSPRSRNRSLSGGRPSLRWYVSDRWKERELLRRRDCRKMRDDDRIESQSRVSRSTRSQWQSVETHGAMNRLARALRLDDNSNSKHRSAITKRDANHGFRFVASGVHIFPRQPEERSLAA